jgi:glyoxylase-like metal-dependent hydrolase (beta-lactamase superfamily II)
VREIVPDVLTWPWFSERHGYDFNGYLVRHAGGNVCIDPVAPSDAVLEALGREGAAVVAITNRNHVRAANAVRARTGARTLIHPLDAPYAKSQGAEIDGDLRVGATVGPFTIVGVPGKSPGEVALHWPDRRVLVVGDAIIGNPPGSCGLLPAKVIDDGARLRQSLGALLALDFDTLLVGDGTPILGGAKERLRDLCTSLPES